MKLHYETNRGTEKIVEVTQIKSKAKGDNNNVYKDDNGKYYVCNGSRVWTSVGLKTRTLGFTLSEIKYKGA